MISSEGDIKLARTVVRVPEVEKWDKTMLSGVRATPHDLHKPREVEVILKDKVGPEKDNFQVKPHMARQVYIRASDLEEFGMTRGCPKCDYFVKYGTWGTRPHSNACRARISAELSKTSTGRLRINAAAERLDKTVEELGQQFRADVPQGEKVEEVVQRQTEQAAPNFFRSSQRSRQMQCRSIVFART